MTWAVSEKHRSHGTILVSGDDRGRGTMKELISDTAVRLALKAEGAEDKSQPLFFSS
jgi:hypothetical protein